MATVLNFSNFTFTAEQIREVSELVMDKLMSLPNFNRIHTIFPDIVTNKEVGFVGEGGLVGVENQGCDPTAQDYNVATRKVTWTPKEWEVLVHQCYSDLQSTAAVYSRKAGVKMADFSESDYMALIVDCLTRSIEKMMWRMTWFGDTTYSTTYQGANAQYFTMFDGLFKQIFTQLTTNTAQYVAFASHSTATSLFDAMVKAAPMALRQSSNKVLLVTQSVYDMYEAELIGAAAIPAAWTAGQEGMPELKYKGISVIAMPVWDEMIASFNKDASNGNVVYPNRAVFTTPEVLGVGVDSMSSLEELNVWYDRDSRKVKAEAMGIMDAKLLNPEFLVASY